MSGMICKECRELYYETIEDEGINSLGELNLKDFDGKICLKCFCRLSNNLVEDLYKENED